MSAEMATSSFDFELHYGLASSPSARDLLGEILGDIVCYPSIHDWEKKLIVTPLQTLVKIVQLQLRDYLLGFNTYLDNASVEEVFTVGEINSVIPAIRELGEAGSVLFFTKSLEQGHNLATISGETGTSPGFSRLCSPGGDNTKLLDHAQGRIIYISELDLYHERAVLLLLYPFCLRLQYEDYGYIRAFIERHLSVRCALQWPYHWQEKSPPLLSSSQQQCFRRVSLSFHLTYLTLGSKEVGETRHLFDRVPLFPFLRRPAEGDGRHLLRASSSVLLTLVIPEESESSEEEICLLQHPQALWTVLVVNSHQQFISDHRRPEHGTPIAQFIRGIASTLFTHRIHAESIYNTIQDEVNASDDGSLFDDENFSKSTLYHLAIKACDEVDASISSCLGFLQRIRDNQVSQLCREAHPWEKSGIDHWSHKLEEETVVLEDLQVRIRTLSSQVRESRNALSGITAVLEARIALQQAERMKSLAYLATIYLPLTAASSLYGMSVLPESASLASFVIVVIVFFFATILLGLNLSTSLQKIHHIFQWQTLQQLWRDPLRLWRDPLRLAPRWMKNNIEVYISLVDRSSHRSSVTKLLGLAKGKPPGILGSLLWFLYQAIIFLVRILPGLVLRYCLVPEILYPKYQWYLFVYRHHLVLRPHITYKYSPVLFFVDVIRFSLIPAWVVFAAGILLFLALQDSLLAGFSWVGSYC